MGKLVSVALVLALVACAWLVWPTPYRTLSIPRTPHILAAREQRFTGRVELLTSHGWIVAQPPTAPDDTTGDLWSQYQRARRAGR